MLKTLTKRVLLGSGALRIASRLAGKGIAVLMYHSVADDRGMASDPLGGIGHPTSIFQQQMEVLARDFHPISLDEALAYVRGGRDVPRRSVVVTFDDGYADNYQVAVPLLNKIGIPATFYVTVDPVQRKRLPWPGRVRYALFTTREPGWVAPDGQNWPLHEAELRAKAFERASEDCSKLAGIEQDEYVAGLEAQMRCALTQGPRMMTWDEIRATVKQGHLVGSHTMTHPNMAHINDQDLKRELAESKRILERELGTGVVHFSYPCPALQPHWTEHTVTMSRECGYQTGVTTNGGLVRRNDNPLQLKRIRPSKTVSGLRANLELAFVGHKT